MKARASLSKHERWSVASRVGAAVLGGYALAAFFASTVSLLVRHPREEALHLGTLPSFLVFLAAVLWAFASRSAWRAWLGILIPLSLLALLTWLLNHTPPS